MSVQIAFCFLTDKIMIIIFFLLTYPVFAYYATYNRRCTKVPSDQMCDSELSIYVCTCIHPYTCIYLLHTAYMCSSKLCSLSAYESHTLTLFISKSKKEPHSSPRYEPTGTDGVEPHPYPFPPSMRSPHSLPLRPRTVDRLCTSAQHINALEA